MKNSRVVTVWPTLTILMGLTSALVICDQRPAGAAGRFPASDAVRTARCANVKAFYAQYPRSSGYARNGRALIPGTSRAGQQKSWALQRAMAEAPICKAG